MSDAKWICDRCAYYADTTYGPPLNSNEVCGECGAPRPPPSETRSAAPSAKFVTSQRYMLSSEFKPLVLGLYQQVRSAIGDNVAEHQLHHWLECRPDLLPLTSSDAACAAGQLRGITLAVCSSVRELLAWARTPDVEDAFVAEAVHGARRLANLDEPLALERFKFIVARYFARRAEIGELSPLLRLRCEGCRETEVFIYEDGTVSCSLTGATCLFEWLPVVDTGRRVLLCSDCAAEAHAIKLAGFAPLFLEEFQASIEDMNEARRVSPDDDSLYNDGASVAHYEAAMRCRRHEVPR